MAKQDLVIGAEHHPEATTAGWDFWWRNAASDVVAVFHGFGGGGGGPVIAGWVHDAMTEPEGSSLEARARWPIERAHATLLARVTLKGSAGGTMACVAIGEGRAAIAHVGEARVYAVTASGLELLTRDHTLSQSRDPESMKLYASNPKIDLLLRAVGIEDRFAIDVIERALAPGEVLALCTPNVCKWLGDELGSWLAVGAQAPSEIVRNMQSHQPRRPGAVAMVFPSTGSVAAPTPTLAEPMAKSEITGGQAAVSGLPLYLVMLQSSDRPLVGRKWPMSSLPAVVTIGRDPACTLEIRSDSVSRRHARLERRPDGWHVVDEASAGGTYVNDARVEDALLRHDDEIWVGDTLLKIAEVIVDAHVQSGPPDKLTGLSTRRDLMEHLDRAMRGAARPLALIRVDIDRLRVINDEQGFEAGDRVLAEIGARLRSELRPGEYAGRISADDFVIVLPETDLSMASARAAELQAKVSTTAPVSVGAAEVAPHHRDADEAVYDAEKDLVARRTLSRSR